jgi:hydrogenase maturation protease
MTAPVVVFAVGNPSRGDDAIGPVICRRLAEWLENEGLADQVELIEDFQLNIEHALDLQGRELALFIDAGENTPAPFIFEQIYSSTAAAHSTHALPPQAVLQVYRQMDGTEPPPSFVLCVRGEKFELGEPLTAVAENHAEVAFELSMELCRQPRLAKWEAAATSVEQTSIN